jgi:hypothetical protein
MESISLDLADKKPTNFSMNLTKLKILDSCMGLPKKYASKERPGYGKKLDNRLFCDFRILELLDFLKCPILLMPLFIENKIPRRLGFFTDLRSTDIQSISLLKDITTSLACDLTIINVADKNQPPIDNEYAAALFKKSGLSCIEGKKVDLLHLKHKISKKGIEAVLIENKIDLLATVHTKKELLYDLLKNYCIKPTNNLL